MDSGSAWRVKEVRITAVMSKKDGKPRPGAAPELARHAGSGGDAGKRRQ